MTSQNLVLLAALTLAVACKSNKEIDDDSMEASAASAGASSAAMTTVATDAEETAVQAQVQSIGSGLSGLASQHQAYATTNDATPEADADVFAANGETGEVSWDGTTLVIDTKWDSSGISYIYEVNLSFADDTIDGTYDLAYTVDIAGVSADWTVSADYNALKFDESGCVVEGTLAIDWNYDYAVAGLGIPSGTATKGNVSAIFEDCNVVTLRGSN